MSTRLNPLSRACGVVFAGVLLALAGTGSSRAQTAFSFDTGGDLITQAGATAAVAPTITAPPATTLGQVGGTYTFSVVASGTGPLTYQWYENNTAISGATGSTLIISNAQSGNFTNYANGANSYDVIVTDSAGSVTRACPTGGRSNTSGRSASRQGKTPTATG
jgi:hypothetical protein